MASDFFKKKVSDVVGAVTDKIGALVDKFQRDKEVIPCPTYGYRKSGDENTWVIPVRVW